MTDLTTPTNPPVPQPPLAEAAEAADAWFANLAKPTNPITAPVDQTTAPVNMTTTPIDQTTAPVNMTTAPVNMTTAPVNMTTAPVNMTTAPIDQTTAPVQPQQAQKPFYQFTPQDRDTIINSLPQEMRTPYEKSLPVITEIAQRFVEHALNNGVASKFDQIEQYTAQQLEWQDRQFELSIQQRVPNIDGLMNDPNFARYLDTPIPYSGGMTPRKALLAAYDSRDLHGVTDVFAGYAARAQLTQLAQPLPTPAMQPSPYANAAPARANGGGTPIPMSAVNKAQADFSAGRITREVFGVLLNKFEAAQRAGLIDPTR